MLENDRDSKDGNKEGRLRWPQLRSKCSIDRPGTAYTVQLMERQDSDVSLCLWDDITSIQVPKTGYEIT